MDHPHTRRTLPLPRGPAHGALPTATAWAALALALAGCAPAEVPEADASVVAEEEQQRAEAAWDPAVFDTISWASDQAAVDRGALVFRVSCSKCHGPSGRGDGGFVHEGDTVRPPSLVEEEWRFADDPAGLRRHIFVGTTGGMPHWGLEGLKPRDMDAAASFITEWLRRADR